MTKREPGVFAETHAELIDDIARLSRTIAEITGDADRATLQTIKSTLHGLVASFYRDRSRS